MTDNEDTLIAAVARANPNTIVVLSTSNPVSMPWINNVPEVFECGTRLATPLESSTQVSITGSYSHHRYRLQACFTQMAVQYNADS
jgi:hypothetical protein